MSRSRPFCTSIGTSSSYLTAFSGDGTLIHLYSPYAMLIFLALNAWKQGIEVPGLRAIVLTLTFIVTPVTFLIVHDHRFEGQVRCVALGILFYLVLRYPLSAPLNKVKRNDELAHPDASSIEGVILPSAPILPQQR